MNSPARPLFSIVIPTFNHAIYLKECLDSVFSQTFQNFEVLVIDTHSTDQTPSLVKTFDDNRLRYLRIRNEGIIAKSRNLGISEAKGTWIALLDSDDYWKESKLERIAMEIDDHFDVYYHHLQIIKSNKGSGVIRGRRINRNPLSNLMTKGNAIPNSSAVIRRTSLLKVGNITESEEMIGFEDFETWLKLGKSGCKFKLVCETLGYYRIHENNTTNFQGYSIPYPAISSYITDVSLRDRRLTIQFYQYLEAKEMLKLGRIKEGRLKLRRVIAHGRLILRLKSIYFILVSIGINN